MNMMKKAKVEPQKGFTLIELLVVISIISLLSSVVMSSLGSARDKANIAAGLKFDKSVFNALGSEAVLVWDFEEDGNTVIDWANGVTGTFSGAGVTRVDGVSGKALDFNGSSYVTLDGAKMEQVVNSLPANPDSVLITAWVYFEDYGGNGWANIATRFPYILYFGINGGKLKTMVHNNGQNSWPESNGIIPPNKWTHVALQIQKGKGVKYFINGKLDRDISMPLLTYVWQPGQTPFIGTWTTSESTLTGKIDDIRFYYKGVLE